MKADGRERASPDAACRGGRHPPPSEPPPASGREHGRRRRCTLTRDVDQWFVSIQCEQEVPEPARRPGPVVAIDRGVTNLLADSDGGLVPNPKHLDASLRQLAHAQRVVARRTKGSQRRARARLRVAKLHRTIRRQRATSCTLSRPATPRATAW